MNKQIIVDKRINVEKDYGKENSITINLFKSSTSHLYEYVKFDLNNNYIIYNKNNAIFDRKGPSFEELCTIYKIISIFKWKVGIVHRINHPDGIKTPDIINLSSKEIEYWDIKNIKEAISTNSKKNKIRHIIESGKGQTTNFIIDINNYNCNLTNEDVLKQINAIYDNPRYCWVNKILFFGKNDYVKLFKRE